MRALLPIFLLIVAMLCFQGGAVLAKGLFPLVGAGGTAALRLAWSALVLCAVSRPWKMKLTWKTSPIIFAYGLSMGLMNYCFYLSLRTIPLGIAVALEFTGPLSVAMLASRRGVDFLWIALAAGGLLALLPLGFNGQSLPLRGILLALGAGLFWALYIVFGRRAGALHGMRTTSIGMLIGACAIVPVGLASNGLHLFAPATLPAAFAVGMLSSAIPYSLEMYALPRVPARTLGVLMSLDPALAALSGLLFLRESLTAVQWAAIVCIIFALGRQRRDQPWRADARIETGPRKPCSCGALTACSPYTWAAA